MMGPERESKAKRAAELANNGWTNEQIRVSMGISASNVGLLIHEAKKLGWITERGFSETMAIPMPAEVRTKLGEEARRRQMAPNALASRLIAIICSDGLFKAVLDQ